MTDTCGHSRIDYASPHILDATIDGSAAGIHTLNNGAWAVLNWDQVLGFENRGSSLLVPGAPYTLPRELQPDEVEATLFMAFDGNLDHTNTQHTGLSLEAGLEINRRQFLEAAVKPPPTTDNVFTLSLTMADSTVLSAPIQVLGFRWARGEVEGLARATWTVRIHDEL